MQDNEGYPHNWKHCLIHLNPDTGEMHSDGDHSVREWIKDKIRAAEGSGSATVNFPQQANTAIALAERYRLPFSSESVICKVMDGFVVWLQEQQQ